jgi:hypothetical protein
MLNPAKTNAQVISVARPNHIGKSVTRNVLAHAMSRAQRHAIRVIDPTAFNDDDDGYDFIDCQVGYGRPKIVKVDFDNEVDVSDHAKFRLTLARELALKAYREKYT